MTAQQRKVLDFITQFIARKRHSPSFQEIADHMDYSSISTIHKHILALEDMGRIRRTSAIRGIEVIPEDVCPWQPIAQIHEDHGTCVVIDIEDPGYIEVAHVCQETPIPFSDVLKWATHFAPLPRLTNEDAERLLEEMKAERLKHAQPA